MYYSNGFYRPRNCSKFNEDQKELKSKNGIICSLCCDILSDPVKLNCGHIFCKECLSYGKCTLCDEVYCDFDLIVDTETNRNISKLIVNKCGVCNTIFIKRKNTLSEFYYLEHILYCCKQKKFSKGFPEAIRLDHDYKDADNIDDVKFDFYNVNLLSDFIKTMNMTLGNGWPLVECKNNVFYNQVLNVRKSDTIPVMATNKTQSLGGTSEEVPVFYIMEDCTFDDRRDIWFKKYFEFC